MPDTRGAADLGDFSKLSTEQREVLASRAAETKTLPKVKAFAVVIGPTGAVLAHADVKALEDYETSACTIDEIAAGCHLVIDDVNASKAGQITCAYLQQQAQAAAEMAKNQAAWSRAQTAANGGRR